MINASIVRIGDPLLKLRAKELSEFNTKELNELVDFLFFNMKHYNGVGLAAPQIGESKRIIVYGFDHNPRYPNEKPVPLTVLINPEILSFSEEQDEYYEGCLSVPNIRGLVPRSTSIKYRAYTVEGKMIEKETKGFEARIIQHEVNHLDGILFPMKMTDISSLKYVGQ